MDVEFRYATPDDVEELIANLREADRQELIASDGDPAEAVRRSVRESVWAVSCVIKGKLAAINGVAPIDGLLGSRGSPWMLGTPVIDRHPSVLVRASRWYVDVMLDQYPHLLNFMDARNTRSIRWLKGLGFTIHPAYVFNGRTHPFHLFELRK